jgi:CTP synthase
MSYHINARKAKKLETKFIFISGGVISSVGKGVTTASLATLLESRGFTVAPVKMDAYLNVDAGTIRPQEHGEVFVTNDGSETDLDIGHYERFIDVNLNNTSIYTSGKLYEEILNKERTGDYLGNDVQIIPHFTDLIKAKIRDSYVAS